MQEIPVTQITPDDILAEGGPITPATEDGSPTQRQIEQDVVTVNPSADSMESRGEFPAGASPVVLQVSGGAFRTGTGSKHLSPRPKNLRKRA